MGDNPEEGLRFVYALERPAAIGSSAIPEPVRSALVALETTTSPAPAAPATRDAVVHRDAANVLAGLHLSRVESRRTWMSSSAARSAMSAASDRPCRAIERRQQTVSDGPDLDAAIALEDVSGSRVVVREEVPPGVVAG